MPPGVAEDAPEDHAQVLCTEVALDGEPASRGLEGSRISYGTFARLVIPASLTKKQSARTLQAAARACKMRAKVPGGGMEDKAPTR